MYGKRTYGVRTHYLYGARMGWVGLDLMHGLQCTAMGGRASPRAVSSRKSMASRAYRVES